MQLQSNLFYKLYTYVAYPLQLNLFGVHLIWNSFMHEIIIQLYWRKSFNEYKTIIFLATWANNS